jgi:hypothetical protein
MDELEPRPAAADRYAVYVLDGRSRRVWEHLETLPSRRDAALTAAVVAQHEEAAATRVVPFPAGVPVPRSLDATLGDGAVPAPAPDESAAPASVSEARRGGWYRASDWRLDGHAANRAAALLEGSGWRAESVELAQGVALVEVRAVAVRGMPLVATLRTRREVEAFLREHPGVRRPGPRLTREAWAAGGGQ